MNNPVYTCILSHKGMASIKLNMHRVILLKTLESYKQMELCHVVSERPLRRHGAIDNPNGRSSLSGLEPTFSNATTEDSAGFSLTLRNTTTGKGVVLVRRSRIRLNAGFTLTGNNVGISTTAQNMKNELKLAVTICHLSI